MHKRMAWWVMAAALGVLGLPGGALAGQTKMSESQQQPVASPYITDGTVAAADLADNAVTSAKILDGTIATADLVDNAVTDAKVVDTLTASNYLPLAGGTLSGNVVIPNAGTIGQALGPLLTFDDTANELEISGGNVGIGTTGPAGKLHVYSNTSSAVGKIILESSTLDTATSGHQIEWRHNATDINAQIKAVLQSSGDSYMSFSTRNVSGIDERVRINKDGNVGIGTTSNINNLLTLAQDSAISWINGNSYTWAIQKSTNDLAIKYSSDANPQKGTAAMYFQGSTGNVGIGTTGPSYDLHINGTDADFGLSRTSGATLLIQAGSGSANTQIRNLTANGLAFWTNNTEKMVIESGGNVGIGTTSPASPLHVKSSTAFYAKLETGAGQNTGLNLINGAINNYIGTDGSQMFFFVGDGATQEMTILNNGNVGIGMTGPIYQLQLSTDSAGKPNGGSWANSSDERLKTDIVPITNGLERLSALTPVSFSWRHPELHGGLTATGGFIAQEVMRQFPSWVTQIEAAAADKALVGPDGKAYSLTLPFEFDAMVVSAIKELQSENAQLKALVCQNHPAAEICHQ